MGSITRTVVLNDLDPAEVAVLFTDMDSHQQAAFFGHVWRIAGSWPGAGWCQQSCDIVQQADKDAQDAIAALSDHLLLARGGSL